MSAADLPRVGIIITSKNRKELLRRTLRETMRQTYRPLEVAVFDDGSTDGTEEMIRAEFPSVRVERSAQSKGYIRSRN
ncbi:glycosyltransferase family 2 protein, partial [Candidatus Sumerlaeota bacterium]|nr:glycosyltransferase family 2 protein [Candidatus Sumerlaeota bacterium]